MNIIENLIIPFETEYYYELDFDKEKYTTWLKNFFASDIKNFIGSLYSWGFNYKNIVPFLTQKYEDRFQGEVRGEFIEKNKRLYLKITVFSVNRLQMYLIPIIVTIVITLIFKNILFSLFFGITTFFIFYENNRMMILRGNQLLKSIENLLEIKKRIAKEEIN